MQVDGWYIVHTEIVILILIAIVITLWFLRYIKEQEKLLKVKKRLEKKQNDKKRI
jgi:hypothetical protein